MKRISQPSGDLHGLKSSILKRSVVVGGRKTSVSLEDAFWGELRRIATDRHSTISDLMAEIDDGRGIAMNLSSCVRLFVLQNLREAAARVHMPAADDHAR